MDMKKASSSNNIPLIAAVLGMCVAAFVIGERTGKNEQTSAVDANSCAISIEATNVDGNITTKMKTGGSQDSCYTLSAQISAYTAGNQEAQGDDSAASDADEASAPCDASAPQAASQ